MHAVRARFAIFMAVSLPPIKNNIFFFFYWCIPEVLITIYKNIDNQRLHDKLQRLTCLKIKILENFRE